MLQPRAKLGKYSIERQLGRGAMGTVFLAFDETLKRQVAIKVLESSADDDVARGRVLREARSASALNHPNICTVYDVGEENHSAFIVMEFVDGRPLSDLVASRALPVEDAVRHGIEAADALAHAHDRGVVHRDLKAANAMVTSSGRLKIVDFGLARQIDPSAPDTTTWASRTEAAGTFGTPYAMAPEQVRGETADARSDVWALGVMLYEMLAGDRPFNGPTVADVFSAILRDPPAPLPLTIPDPLREIVHRCLAKDRTRRYERASDVRLVLEAIAAGFRRAAAAGPVGDPGSPLPVPSIVTAATEASSFVGREDRLAEITRAWDRVKAGRRQLMLLAGEPGMGKTRLSMEFARRCAEARATILVGRSDEEALLPFQPFVEALTWYVRVCPEPDLRVQLAAIGGGAELAPLIIELLQRVPEVPAQPAMNPEGQRYRLFEAVDALLAVVSAAHPVLMVLDDLHWADKATLLMLRHLVRSPRPASLCIVATYRESELGRTHPLAEMLADLRLEPAVTRVSLRGLDQTEVRRLVGMLVGRDTPPEFALAVGESTGGNPFFIAEIMRHLAESGALSRLEDASRGGALADLGLPQGVKEVIGRRLSRLSEDCNRTLSLAAVIGRDFDVDVLLALDELKEESLLDALDEAVRARLADEAPGRQGRFSFTHALIRETLHGELTSARRMRLHRRVGEAIEQLWHGRPNPPLADLAYHFVQAAPTGVADKAIDYSTRAGDRAADALAHEEAARFYDLALQSLEYKEPSAARETRLVDLHTRRGRSFGALGMWALEKPELEQALRYLDPADVATRCALLIDLAFCTFWLLDIPSTRRLATEALALAEQLHDTIIIANARGLLANCQQADGDLPAAKKSFQWVIDHGGLDPSAWIAACMAPLTWYWVGEAPTGTALAERAAQIARTSGNALFVMHALPHLALNLAGCGRYAEAISTFEEAVQFARKYGVRPLLARTIAMSAGFHVSLFDWPGAEARQTEARDLAKSVGIVPPVVSANIDRMLTLARQRDPGRAETLLVETSAAVAATLGGWHGWLWRLRLVQARAEMALARGDYDAAIVEGTDSIDQSRAKGRVKYETLGLVTRAQALHALGRSREAIADARRSVEIARATTDPALLLTALDTLLCIEGDDESVAEARSVSDRILVALPDETMRTRFTESEVVQRVRRG